MDLQYLIRFCNHFTALAAYLVAQLMDSGLQKQMFNGCITATQSPVEQQLCCQIFLPDAFTPNNDTKNDVYRILEYGGGVIMGEFRIYNRWGQEVFSTRDITQGWDGNFKGQPQNMDTYSYVVVYQCNEKGVISQKVKKGDLILVR